ncbi:2968_t:CDS:2 [Entrophospora sp. SA101]|nr:2968_t:CDS:2 [Entrophospora sp. SA101]
MSTNNNKNNQIIINYEEESQEEKLSRIRKLFQELDYDNTGFLDRENILKNYNKLKNHPFRDKYASELLEKCDVSSDGIIDFEEFKFFIEEKEKELWKLFLEIDKSRDMFLQPEELEVALTKAGIHCSMVDLKNLISLMDKDKVSLPDIYQYYEVVAQVSIDGDVIIPETNPRYLIAGALAGAVSRTATAPFDRLKIYLQTQTNLNLSPLPSLQSLSHFGQWKHGKVLLGTSLSWFALDVAFYGLGLNNAIILDAIGLSSKTDDQFTGLANIALGNVVITLLGTIPGYWVTVFTVDKIGRKTIQLLGFTMLTILFIILGFGYHAILDKSFFQNFGPNTTTFIIPGEVFPTKYRSTAFGISAASGKFGAIVAQIGFFQMKDIGGKNAFLPHLFEISALIMFIGLLATFLVPETKGISLEDLAGLIFASNTVNGEARDMSADPLFLRKASAMA